MNGTLVAYSDAQIVPGIVALVRPNVKLTLRGSWAKLARTASNAGGNPVFAPGEDLQPGQVQLSLALGV